MKTKEIILLFIFFLPLIAMAEYNGHQIKFVIELTDGNEIHGYNYLASVYKKDKSISYKEFLEKNYEVVLRNQFNDSLGDLTYFQHRIKYDYKGYFDEESRFIFTLTDKKSVSKSEIKSLKIIELTDQSYAIGISTNHNWKDRLWMNTEPVEKYSFGGIFCTHYIFIHEKTNKTEEIIKELEKISNDFDVKIKEQQEEMKYSDGKPYYGAEERIEKLEEEIDEKISQVLGELDGEKVVIITMCTC